MGREHRSGKWPGKIPGEKTTEWKDTRHVARGSEEIENHDNIIPRLGPRDYRQKHLGANKRIKYRQKKRQSKRRPKYGAKRCDVCRNNKIVVYRDCSARIRCEKIIVRQNCKGGKSQSRTKGQNKKSRQRDQRRKTDESVSAGEQYQDRQGNLGQRHKERESSSIILDDKLRRPSTHRIC
ncbi:hypothetical protein METBIDRAFT_178800 [Metschnikowia bicuspidata var. bicuspidata NRRL YB-4993]|uniref:Uncharacterized protein n=1 Tax=Metschnikowia bicuspidata var. bicuspidata NRRL YB-4993 TaxID=869754 RepID=A0A1A0HBA0_9ASCO|nr:hypothetical protein METBIDRAFT_178800 [Metschnikowia bicuspidata var. bicuspidata NRRL YB-4993]OBA21265.1 hypothetical protein METBIDRAFT_178800 [Metschnikowia bicuspidata var. bicuspidata NRRL YB-4993]